MNQICDYIDPKSVFEDGCFLRIVCTEKNTFESDLWILCLILNNFKLCVKSYTFASSLREMPATVGMECIVICKTPPRNNEDLRSQLP